LTMSTQDNGKCRRQEIKKGFEIIEPLLSEKDIETLGKTNKAVVITLNNLVRDYKAKTQKLEEENHNFQEIFNAYKDEKSKEIDILKVEKSIEKTTRLRLQDRNDDLVQQSGALWTGSLISFLWLCKDICSFSNKWTTVFLGLATTFALWSTAASLLARRHNKKQTDKIKNDYMEERSSDSL